MQTISIETVATSDGNRIYRAAMGDSRAERLRQRQFTGKTEGEALDALTVEIGSQEINGFLLLQSFQPDRFFTAQQQQRLAELMSSWRAARDLGETLPADLPSIRTRYSN